MKCYLGSLIFLKRSLVFPILLFFSISLHWSLRKSFFSLLTLLWNSVSKWVYLSFSPLPFASLLFSAICEVSSDNHFFFLHIFCWGWFWLPPPVQCYKPQPIVLEALCQSDLIPWICLLLPLCNCKGFDLGHTWMDSAFPYFLQFKSEFCNKKFMIWATFSFQSCFC